MKAKHVYEPPKVEVFFIESQGVMCSSGPGPGPVNNATGGTTESLDIVYF